MNCRLNIACRESRIDRALHVANVPALATPCSVALTLLWSNSNGKSKWFAAPAERTKDRLILACRGVNRQPYGEWIVDLILPAENQGSTEPCMQLLFQPWHLHVRWPCAAILMVKTNDLLLLLKELRIDLSSPAEAQIDNLIMNELST